LKNENIVGSQVHGTRLALIIVSLMVSLFLAALDSTVVSTAMKTIVGELQGMEYYAWPFTIYMLCQTVIIPISGGLADIFGRKMIFLIGIFIFLAGSAFCGLAPSMLWLILFRGVQGIGGGIVITCVFTIVADLFPPQLRGKYMGLVTSVFGLSSIVGPLIGGLITDHLSWRWTFYINIPIGAAAVLLILPFLPNFKTAGCRSKIDIPGAVFIVLALTPLLLALSFGGSTYAWGSPEIIGMLVLSAAMLVVFVIVETKAPNPIIPMTFFKDRTMWVTLAAGFLSNAVMYAAVIYIPYFVQGIQGTSATTGGAVTVPMTIALTTTSNIIGVFATHKNNLFKPLMILAFIASAAGCFLLSTLNIGSPYLSVIVYMLILGGGIGITMPIVGSNSQNAAPVEQLAAATGAGQFFRTIGSTVGSAVFGTIMTSSIARGFDALDLSGVPESVRASLRNPQIVTSTEALSQIVSQAPPDKAAAIEEAVLGAKNVLLGGISNVFLFAVAMAAVGIVLSLFFRGAPMRIVHLDDCPPEGGEPEDQSVPETPEA